MKLYELLNEYDAPDIQGYAPRGYPKTLDQPLYPADATKQLGQGAYSIVYSHEDTPHDVLKVSRKNTWGFPRADGFIVYLKWLLESEYKDSRYAPRLRSARLAKDETTFQVRMEKLEDLNSLRASELLNIIKANFDDAFFRNTIKAYTERMEKLRLQIGSMYTPAEANHKISEYNGGLVWDIVERIDDIARMRVDANDPDLTAFLRAIFKLSLTSDFTMDLSNPGNTMARRTPMGVQLVITDPLGGKGI
jgi:hypothetical protein